MCVYAEFAGICVYIHYITMIRIRISKYVNIFLMLRKELYHNFECQMDDVKPLYVYNGYEIQLALMFDNFGKWIGVCSLHAC